MCVAHIRFQWSCRLLCGRHCARLCAYTRSFNAPDSSLKEMSLSSQTAGGALRRCGGELAKIVLLESGRIELLTRFSDSPFLFPHSQDSLGLGPSCGPSSIFICSRHNPRLCLQFSQTWQVTREGMGKSCDSLKRLTTACDRPGSPWPARLWRWVSGLEHCSYLTTSPRS